MNHYSYNIVINLSDIDNHLFSTIYDFRTVMQDAVHCFGHGAVLIIMYSFCSADFTLNSNGGCFGDGPGRLVQDDISTGKFHFQAAYMQSGTKYVMTVRVRKDNRMGTTSQILEVVQGQPLKIIIK